VLAADIFTEKFLKSSASRSGTEPTRTEGFHHFLNFWFPDVWSTEQ